MEVLHESYGLIRSLDLSNVTENMALFLPVASTPLDSVELRQASSLAARFAAPTQGNHSHAALSTDSKT